MESGFAFIEKSDYSVCYEDYGISKGMEEGIKRARDLDHKVLYRRIGENIDNFCEECKGKCCVGLIEVVSGDIMYHNISFTTEAPNDSIKPRSYDRIMRTNSQNQCVALVDGKCSIYTNRPQICRVFKVQSESCNSFRNGKITIHSCEPCKLQKFL
jgi:Fe-S-cluster containining protein